jgi:S1-C subfamily serine protease
MTHRTASRLTARAALALLLAAAGPLSPAGAADAVSQEITEKLCVVRECPPCVVRIHIKTGEAQSGSGTGILLKDGRILTAAHLLRNASPQNRPQVWFGGRAGRPPVNGAEGRPVAWTVCPGADLAVLTGVSAPPWARGASLAAAPPKEGDLLTVVGIEFTGAVRAYAGPLLGVQMNNPLLALGLTIQHGDSGGPAFNASGEVVGILSGAGAFTRTTTTTMEGEGSGELVTTQTTPATFAVDLGKIDWKSF